jgi:hypothetical protein
LHVLATTGLPLFEQRRQGAESRERSGGWRNRSETSNASKIRTLVIF